MIHGYPHFLYDICFYYPSINTSIYLSIHISIYPSINPLSIPLFDHLSISIYLHIQSIYLTFYPSIYLMYPFIPLYIYLSLYLYIYLSIYLSIQIWDLADEDGRGYLDKTGLFVACKLVSLSQANRELRIESIMDETPAPNFGDLTAPGAKVSRHLAVQNAFSSFY